MCVLQWPRMACTGHLVGQTILCVDTRKLPRLFEPVPELGERSVFRERRRRQLWRQRRHHCDRSGWRLHTDVR